MQKEISSTVFSKFEAMFQIYFILLNKLTKKS